VSRPGRAAPSAAVTIAWAAAQAGVPLPVRVRAWDGSEAGPAGGPVLVIHSPRALRRLAWRPGELGLARAYVSGDIDVEPDLTEGLRLGLAATRAREHPSGAAGALQLASGALAALTAGSRLGALGPPPPAPESELRPPGRRNTRSRDQAIIAGHYDTPVEFLQLILDESMAYSCGYWASDEPGGSLADAQRAKLDLVCRKLGLEPGSRLLDLGCGWGSLTVHAAREYRAEVTGVTLSAGQGAHADRRLRAAGLDDRARVRVLHYRDVAGTYDAVASIEMGEHVGDERYPRFCSQLRELLRPGGRVVIQQMSRGHSAPGGGPFIESYVAADMHMRPLGETIGLLERAGLEVVNAESLRSHYVRTIRAWLDNLERDFAAAQALLGDERARLWRLYLAGGALAFEEGRMGVDQIVARKPS
jgi:cyclopropane-fatty-acyl-phospholipid synthase